jgi:hypothetical protein
VAGLVRLPGKRNLRKLPDDALNVVARQKRAGSRLVAACTKRLSSAELATRVHLAPPPPPLAKGTSWTVLPRPEMGRYSNWNITGRNLTRHDLPKIEKSWSWDFPFFGDWAKGSGTARRTRLVYQVDFIPPEEALLEASVLRADAAKDEYDLKFVVQRPIDPADDNCEQRLLFYMNLLQENVGRSSAFPEDTTDDGYLKTTTVDWEIIPVGSRGEMESHLTGMGIAPGTPTHDRILDRYEFLSELGAKQFIRGISGFQRYFGAFFHDNLVVFENTQWGNAIYVMHADWKELAKLTRGDLIATHSDKIHRIVHSRNWKERLTHIVHQYR